MDEETRYEAVRSRDARFDGAFFFAVATTGIYCRPSCPAVTPKRTNVRFYPTAAAAQHSGFRACRRCRPDAAPGSAEWDQRADVVGRAMRMIGDGVVDREGVAGLAGRLGYSARQVQRQLTAELGAGPVALARAQRAHTARLLLQTTALPVTDIAFAAGFASVRQFNDTMRAVYDSTPTALRGASGSGPGEGPARRGRERPAAGVPLRLAHRGPHRTGALFDQLAAEALPGIEQLTGPAGARTYRRTLRLPHGTGIVAVGERGGHGSGTSAARPGGWLEANLHLADLRDLTTAVQRLRRLFDLDADPFAVDERLGADPELAPLVAARPGLRAPGAAEAEEFAVRVLAGPEEARRLLLRHGTPLERPCGTLTHVFPAPAALRAEPGPVGALAAALTEGRLSLDPGADREEAHRAFLALPGADPEMAARIRARALGDPDTAHPGEDPPDSWRPWRTYAHQHLRQGAPPLPYAERKSSR
ncbi:AraC family transcriptional regulator [Streptomyces albus]|uniref:AraC family transcriptional regulator n=1 Tax=Streptomyces albus (strain ATCC 21838 / DSM 41398 / FERM P-419 / JCM 4703 / NBRC 107858) TaxID=1081613 RepID=A0A0B5ESI4_STRA4|nr:AraC family transcriptional regulator [Streptomyces albus]AOU75405.1 AraC family transcriptional regulator [Streptomyces albus]AYN31210.1 AraC family transcriptional regulator [Streptomyces albus]